MTKPAKIRPTSVRVLHSDVKSTVAAKAGPHLKPTVVEKNKFSNSGKTSENKKLNGKIKVNGIGNTANAAAKAYSSGRINISGKVSANGKAALKVNAFSKANSSNNRKAAVVKKSNAGTKGNAKVAEEKKTSAFSKSKAKILANPPTTKAMQRQTRTPAHTLSAASVTITEKSVNSIKSMSNQFLPFDKSAVSGITISTPEKLKTKPTDGYKQVQN